MVDDTSGADVRSLLPWEVALRRAEGRSRILDLVEAPDAEARVQALAPLEVYQAIKAVGPADAVAVLGLLSREQTKTLLDLDVWRAGDLDVSDALTWFEAFRAAGLEALVRAARALDEEALSLLLRRRLLIALKQKDDASDQEPLPDWAVNTPDALMPIVETPDGRFYVAARTHDELDDEARDELDEEERKAILQLVAELYRDEEWDWAAGMLRAAMSDLSSSLTEDALRFRDARLEDLGFPPLERALEVYGPLDPGALAESPPAPYPALSEVLPAKYAEPLSRGLFHAAMSRLEDVELVRRIEGDLVPLANAALVADGAEPGAIEHLQDTLTRARGYIELALAHGTPPGPARVEAVAARLRANHVTVLFRVGYTLTLRAATRARALAANAAFEQHGLPMARLEEPERVALDALRAKRPRVSVALEPVIAALTAGEAPLGLGPAGDEGSRAFTAPEDLDAVEWLLSDLEGLAAALSARSAALGAISDAPANLPAEERTAQVFVDTMLARALLAAPPEPLPLEPAQLEAVAGRLERGRFPEAARREAARAVEAWFFDDAPDEGRAALARRIERGLEGLEGALGPLAGGPIDPRFVPGLLVRAG